MKPNTGPDSYLSGNSTNWKNWQSIYDNPRTCEPCEDKHGKIYPFTSTMG